MVTYLMRRGVPVACTTLLLTGLAACGGNKSGDGNGARDSSAMASSSADSAGAMSGTTTAAGASAMANTSLNDTSVVHLMAAVDQSEAAAGRMASTKATSSDVKTYARMMVQEHTADLKKLQRLASTANITLDSASGSRAAGDVQSNARGGSTEGAAGGSSSGMTNNGGTGTTGAGAAGGSGTMQAGTAGASNNAAVAQLQQNMQQTMSQLQTATGADFDRQYIASQLAGHQQVLDLLRQNESKITDSNVRSHVTAMAAAVEKHLDRARQIQQKLGGDSTSSSTTAR